MEKFKLVIEKIKTSRFSIDVNKCAQLLEENKNKNYIFSMNVSLSVDEDTRLLQIIVEYFVKPSKRSKIILGEISTSTQFKFLDSNVLINGNDILIPKEIQSKLIEVSVSHTRAIFSDKAAGTSLSDYFIPLFNFSDLNEIKTPPKKKTINKK